MKRRIFKKKMIGRRVNSLAIRLQYAPGAGVRLSAERNHMQTIERSHFPQCPDQRVGGRTAIAAGRDRVGCAQ
jgi:hypothetical protein